MIARTRRWTWLPVALLAASCSESPSPEACLESCCDADGDGYGRGPDCLGPDCDDGDPATFPGAPERCDAKDNDCVEGGLDVATIDCASAACELEGGVHYLRPAAVCTLGECVPQERVSCGAFACATADGAAACAAVCVGDEQCAASAHCEPGGCVADLADGSTCDEDSDCESGHCGDGFCCAGGECCQQATDCSTYGTIAAVCDSAATCQGTRGTVACTASTCVAGGAEPDDSACDATILVSDCGPYPAVHCTGAPEQVVPACPTSCADDAGCDANAYCSDSVCVPDGALGDFCAGAGQCQDGLFCSDGVCCTTTCTGTCRRCDLAGHVGTCTNIPAGEDPDGECPGVSCGAYYWGWSGQSCLRKADVTASQTACSGLAACRTTAEECGLQTIAGLPALTCNATCQSVNPATCTGTIAGTCTNLDLGSTTCGAGVCQVTAPLCLNGAENTCVPNSAAATPETCNDIDDDCNGTVDDGAFADGFEPNGSCGGTASLPQVGSDQAVTVNATLYAAGDVDVYLIRAMETDSSCACCDFFCTDEDYRLTVTLTVPAGAGSYSFCASTVGTCDQANCQSVVAGTNQSWIYQLDGACGVSDAYQVFVTVLPGAAPGYECRPYALAYKFDSGLCF